MKTPIEEAVINLRKRATMSSSRMYSHGLYQAALFLETEYLEKEKQEIIEAYYAGTAQFDNAAPIVKPEGPDKYYADRFTPTPA